MRRGGAVALVLALLAAAAGKAVAELNVLLPFSRETKVQHALEAFGGCYHWRSSSPQVISVQAEGGECAARATLRVETAEPNDRVVWIIATEAATGEVIRIESRVDVPQRIEIITKVRTLEVGDFATLELMGFDAQGNAFTTLEGLRFRWSIQQEQPRAEFSTFREASMQPAGARAALEAAGLQGDLAVVKGLQIGEVRVSAALKQDAALLSHAVDVYILEHFAITPEEDLLLMPCDRVQLRLFVLRKERAGVLARPVALPDPKFTFQLVGPGEGAALGAEGELALGADARGSYTVEVSTDNRRENRVEKRVVVAESAWADFAFREFAPQESFAAFRAERQTPQLFAAAAREEWREGASFTFELGKRYLLRAALRADELREVYMGDAKRVAWSLPGEHLKLEAQWRNYALVEPAALARGAALHARILAPAGCSQPELRGAKSYQIVSPVAVVGPFDEEKRVFLPLSEPERQVLHLHGLGGSGDYHWATSDAQVATVSEQGVVRAVGAGLARIVLSDQSSRANSFSVTVVVAVPTRTFALEARKDVWAGEAAPLPLGALGADEHRFGNCTSLAFAASRNGTVTAAADSRSYRQFIEELHSLLPLSSFQPRWDTPASLRPRAYADYLARKEITAEELEALLLTFDNRGLCRIVRVEGQAPAEAVQQFSFDGLAPAAVRVAVHLRDRLDLPLMYDTAVFGAVPIAAPGASVHFVHQQYPQNWFPAADARLRVALDHPAHADALAVHLRPLSGNSGEVVVECRRSVDEPISFAAEFTVRDPTTFYLPLRSSHAAGVRCWRPSRLELHLLPEPFSGFAFLSAPRQAQLGLRNARRHVFVAWAFDAGRHIFWNATSPGAVWSASDPQLATVALHSTEQPVGAASVASLSVAARTGAFRLHCRAAPDLEDSLSINALNQLAIEPAFLALLNRPGLHATLRVVNGSGRFRVSADPAIVSVEHRPDSREVLLRPVRRGNVELFVEDLEVAGGSAAAARVEVVEPTRVEVLLADRSIEEGGRTTAQVQVFADERLISPDQIAQLAVTLTATPALAVEQRDAASFYLTAAEPAVYALTASAAGVTSAAASLAVFERLKLFPAQIALAPGCRGVVHVVGGPSAEQRKAQNLRLHFAAGRGLRVEPLADDKLQISATDELSGVLRVELRDDKEAVRAAEAAVVVGAVDGLSFAHPAAMSVGQRLHLGVAPTIRGVEVTPGWCPLLISGRAQDAQVATLEPVFKSARLQASTHAHFNVTALRAGTATLFFELLPLAEGEGRPGRAVQGTTALTVTAEAAGFWLSFDRRPCAQSALLLPTAVVAELPELALYALQLLPHDRAATLDAGSTLATGPKQGFDVLVYRRKGEEAQFATAIPVYVAAPKSLQLPQLARAGLLAPHSALTLSVRVLDDRGRAFYSPLSAWDFHVFSSAPGVVDVAYTRPDNTLSLQSREPGQALVSVLSRKYPQLRVSWAVHVGSLLLPSGEVAVHVGGSAQFRPSALAGETAPGWRSTDAQVLSVSASGLARALRPGRASVVLDVAFEPMTEVHVVRAEELRALASNPRTATNAPTSPFFAASYELGFELAAGGQPLRLSADPLVDHALGFDCSTNSTVVEATPRASAAPGSFVCEVRFRAAGALPLGAATIRAQVSSLSESWRLLRVVEMQLQPQFALAEGSSALRATPERSVVQAVIRTAEPVEIEAGELAAYTHTQFHAHNQTQVVVVSLPRGHARPLRSRLVLHNRATRQRAELPFSFDPKPSFLSQLSFSFATGTEVGLADLVVIGVCLLIVYYISVEYRRAK